ncbi:Ser/Thr protein kinase RdoA (MazF antagonist) [Crossiella equi]|uniref:Ser/Thr protein kinase RdoA (MazF antagonist) n=1 Tax=Crossiella equi TaxID=130796 RepID=A0ABS5A859_9PSEU|nr:phosphotransferase [Crossiella equi]MBP2472452.1 Ser/Thr protein kinase RdoA (MazF antagonist) [Crossiella equi]
MTELPGGFRTRVLRVGDTVRRPPHPRSAQVRELLHGLADWPGAPRHLGVAEDGWEILEFLPGEAAWQLTDQRRVRHEPGLRGVARLLRELHDHTEARLGRVWCHNDLSPRNTVYRDGRPVAFLDWDLAAPGERVHDLAHLCWQFLDLGQDTTEVAVAAPLMAAVCAEYGFADPAALVPAVLWWQDRARHGILAGAGAGEASLVRLREFGVPERIAAAREWTAAHETELRRALGS